MEPCVRVSAHNIFIGPFARFTSTQYKAVHMRSSHFFAALVAFVLLLQAPAWSADEDTGRGDEETGLAANSGPVGGGSIAVIGSHRDWRLEIRD